MRYICLGYIEENKWETMSEGDRNSMMDECFATTCLKRAAALNNRHGEVIWLVVDLGLHQTINRWKEPFHHE